MKDTTLTAIRLEALLFLRMLLDCNVPSSFHPHISGIVRAVVQCSSDEWCVGGPARPEVHAPLPPPLPPASLHFPPSIPCRGSSTLHLSILCRGFFVSCVSCAYLSRRRRHAQQVPDPGRVVALHWACGGRPPPEG
jgi:hypothetical protein